MPRGLAQIVFDGGAAGTPEAPLEGVFPHSSRHELVSGGAV